MLQRVDVGERSLEAYRGVAPDETVDELRRQAEQLRGARVLHINATPYGGGVSELLRSTVPLLNDLGLIADAGRAVYVVHCRCGGASSGRPPPLYEEQWIGYGCRQRALST